MRLLRDLLTFAVCGLLFVVLAPLAALWPALAWRNRLSLVAGRAWSRAALWIWGIRVRYAGLENLRHPAILTFNHTAICDFFVLAALAGDRCLVFGKRELARIPFLGWGWLLGGHPMIRREDRAHWQAELDRVERLLRDAGYSACIAPEGSRNRTGELLPFKKGVAHLAVGAGLPIVPVVIEGGAAVMTGRRPVPGELRVRVLPAVDTSAWSAERVDEHLAALRELYQDALRAPGGGGPPRSQPLKPPPGDARAGPAPAARLPH